MKNWFRALETPKADFLLRKVYGEGQKPGLLLEVEMEIGCSFEATILYKSEKARDKAFQKFTPEWALECFENLSTDLLANSSDATSHLFSCFKECANHEQLMEQKNK